MENMQTFYIHIILHVMVYPFSGCEITVGRRTCPINLAERPIEKRFVLLNVRTMSYENLFVFKS